MCRSNWNATCTALRLRWPDQEASPEQHPDDLEWLLDCLPQLQKLDASECPPHLLYAVAMPSLTSLDLRDSYQLDNLNPLSHAGT